MSLSVIVLAGGRGSRMGGVDKAGVRLNGVRLLDHVLAGLDDAAEVIVVSSHSPPVGAGVRVVSERPPFGGPVAGIAAGFRAVRGAGAVAVLSVDAPDSPGMLSRLQAALEAEPTADVALIRSTDGFLQPLCALWRPLGLEQALRALGDPRGRAAKRLIAVAGSTVEVPGEGLERDYDTVAELGGRGRVELP